MTRQRGCLVSGQALYICLWGVSQICIRPELILGREVFDQSDLCIVGFFAEPNVTVTVDLPDAVIFVESTYRRHHQFLGSSSTANANLVWMMCRLELKVALQRAALASWSAGELKRLSINLNETAAKLKDRKSISWMIPKSSAGGGLEVIATRSDLRSSGVLSARSALTNHNYKIMEERIVNNQKKTNRGREGLVYHTETTDREICRQKVPCRKSPLWYSSSSETRCCWVSLSLSLSLS
ncbi:hypothetical protein YC2023_079760 [Brassica napus]